MFSKLSASAFLVLAALTADGAASEPAPLRRLPPIEASEGFDACEQAGMTPAGVMHADVAQADVAPAGVVQAANIIPVQRLSLDGLRPVESDRFATPRMAQNASAQLQNNFTAAPEFTEGAVVVGENVALKIGGYVKADLIHDFDPIDSTDSFDTTSIPVGAAPRENSRFHARQSRLSFDTRWRVDDETVRVFIESDFFGTSANDNDTFRLRHAYGELGRFLAGRTWTTFTDPSAVPQTLDFEGAVSNVNRRQGQVRWTQPIGDGGWSVAGALENPETIIDVPMTVAGDARTESPDLVGRLRSELEWGEFQAAGVVRRLGFQPFGQDVISRTAWGFNFTGSFLVAPETKGYYQITFGEGIGSYRGSPDVVAIGPTTAQIMPMFGWMVGAKQEWTDRLTSNVTYSRLKLDDLPGQAPDNLLNTTYLAVNLIYNPYERVFWGVEYLYGVRENVNLASASANRLQMSFGFYLP